MNIDKVTAAFDGDRLPAALSEGFVPMWPEIDFLLTG